jgi:ribosomal protein S18 acetylase RimI-like enzyme
MGATTLREANHTDANALGALHVASWHETYTGIIPAETLAGLSADARAAMWGKILGSPEEYGCVAVFVVEDGGLIVGFGCCGKQRDEMLADAGFSGEISAIYILRPYQGRGAGRSIMAAMARALTAAGHAAACLWVLRENSSARAFYEMLGGVIVGEKADEQPGATLIEMAYGWRDLTGLISQR